MADMYLDDVRGYWKGLAAPAFEEFWAEYQIDVDVSSNRLTLIYRRLITASLFLNHLSDKAALLHGRVKGNHFMDEVQAKDAALGSKLHACRHFANDAKHEMQRIQEASLRHREKGFDDDGESLVVQFRMLSTDGNELHEICRVVTEVWRFWIGYFDGSAPINYKDALALRAGAVTSSSASC
jgi:hypothetical protein